MEQRLLAEQSQALLDNQIEMQRVKQSQYESQTSLQLEEQFKLRQYPRRNLYIIVDG